MGDEIKERSRGGLRAFSALLSAIENGRLHADLSREVEDLVAKLQDLAGGNVATKGTINIALAVKYDPKSGMFEISGDYKVKSPTERRGSSVFWATPQNALTLDNPRQQQMFPRDVNDGRSEVRNV